VRYAVRHPELGMRWLQTRVEPATLASGQRTASVVTLDVTEQHTQQQRSEQLLHEMATILDSSLAGIAYLRANVMVRCNRRFETMLGLPGGELAGSSLQELFGPSAQGQRIAVETQRALRDHTTFETEFGVPLPILLSVSYNESLWEAHGGKPSFAGGYGPMNLTNLTQDDLNRAGFSSSFRTPDLLKAPALHTAAEAAALAGIDVATAEADDAQNIRAGAALLASYEKQYNHGILPPTRDLPGWTVAVARYSEATETKIAQVFAILALPIVAVQPSLVNLI